MAAPANDATRIMEVGLGFWPSKVLLTAVELEVFTKLGASSMTGEELGHVVGMHPRGIADFFDALTALDFLEREGSGATVRYRNTAATAKFLDKNSPTYMGGMLEMANQRLYRFWADLGEALKTGRPQNEVKHSGKSMFEALYQDEAQLEQFVSAMRVYPHPTSKHWRRRSISRGVHRHRELDRRCSPRERVRPDDVTEHADRVRRCLRLHGRRLLGLVQAGGL